MIRCYSSSRPHEGSHVFLYSVGFVHSSAMLSCSCSLPGVIRRALSARLVAKEGMEAARRPPEKTLKPRLNK